MKRIVSVNQLTTNRAVLMWYFGRRREGDNVRISTLHKSWYEERNSGIDKSIAFRAIQEPETIFSRSRILETTRPVILFTHMGITTTCREYSATRDDSTAQTKGVVGDDTIHDAKITSHYGRYGIEVQIDSSSGHGSKSLVVISRGVDRHVTEVSARCKQSMCPETVAP